MMRSCHKLAALAWALPAVLTARAALADDASSKADAAKDDSKVLAPDDADVKVTVPPKGYIPGSRRTTQLGLTPYAPRSPGFPGSPIPWSAPEPEDSGFQFNFGGYMSASARLSSNTRPRATGDQYSSTLHGLPQTVDVYGAVQGTNAPPGSWVELRFDYGNSIVKSVVKLSTWKPSVGQSWIETSSQNWVNEAFLVFTMPGKGDFNLSWTVGAFRNTYGGLGQYGVGQYNAPIIGAPFGLGETLTLQYAVADNLSLILEHGVMGRSGKFAPGAGPNVWDHEPSPSEPSAFVNHAHLGFSLSGEVPIQGGLHYLSNFAQDERDQLDDPKTFFTDESHRPDPKMTVLGADLRMINNYLGNGAIAFSYADANNAQLLSGMNYFGSDSGELFTDAKQVASVGRVIEIQNSVGGRGLIQNYIGQDTSSASMSKRYGTGSLFTVGGEYDLSLAHLLLYPHTFDGKSHDLVLSLFGMFTRVQSKDTTHPDGKYLYNNINMLKFGAEAGYTLTSWFAFGGRLDHVSPQSEFPGQDFNIISPRIIFHSDWQSRDQVVLQYSHYLYGKHPLVKSGYPLVDDPTLKPDADMVSISANMWW